MLHDRFEAALQMRDVVDTLAGAGAVPRGPGRMGPVLEVTARFLREPGGPNVAAVEFSGWDTHANQGRVGGPLDRLLGQLAEGLVLFEAEMGDHWRDTTVVVMTEFGRTARDPRVGGSPRGGAPRPG